MKCKCCQLELDEATCFLHEAIHNTPFRLGEPLQMVPYVAMPGLGAIMERYAMERTAKLLAPTIALEERFSTVRAGHLPECPCERCMLARELIRDAARLRSILTSGAKSDTNTP